MPQLTLQHWLDHDFHARLRRVERRRAPRLPAPQALVVAPDTSFEYGATAQPFHCASVGKVFTAVLLGRLMDRGLLSLDTPVGELSPAVDLAALPAAPGVDVAHEVTVRHLLSHRSGLPDPLLPPRGHRTTCSLAALTRDPDRRWTPADVLTQTTGLPAIGRPGARFGYTDAGYALLLLIAESVTAEPFARLLQDEVFTPAGMSQTWHPHDDPDVDLDGLDLAPMVLRGSDVSRVRALSAGSVDGGGVTTVHDLLALLRGLRSGTLLRPETVRELATVRSRLRPGVHYGTGLATLRFSDLVPFGLGGVPQPVGGLGLSSVHAFAYPEQGAYVILNLHADRSMAQSFRLHLAVARRLAA